MPETDSTEAVDPGSDSESGIERRTLIRILVGLGLGIPIAVEGLTFVGLLSDLFGGGDAGGTGGGSETARSRHRRVGVGEELLPETTPTETLAEAYILPQDSTWRLTLVAEVTNTAEQPYEFGFGNVHTEAGDAVAGETGTVTVPPGGTATVSGQWDLPAGATVAAVSVRGAIRSGARVTSTAYLERVPVRG